MRSDAGIAFMKPMASTLAHQRGTNALLQLIGLRICAEQVTQIDAIVTKQTQMQLP